MKNAKLNIKILNPLKIKQSADNTGSSRTIENIDGDVYLGDSPVKVEIIQSSGTGFRLYASLWPPTVTDANDITGFNDETDLVELVTNSNITSVNFSSSNEDKPYLYARFEKGSYGYHSVKITKL